MRDHSRLLVKDLYVADNPWLSAVLPEVHNLLVIAAVQARSAGFTPLGNTGSIDSHLDSWRTLHSRRFRYRIQAAATSE